MKRLGKKRSPRSKKSKSRKVSSKYCLNTPIKRMGFSQKASCKARGLIKRTSKKYKGQYIKSSSLKRKSLYNKGIKTPKIKSGYGSKQRAKQTIKNLRGHSKQYKTQIVNTMLNRAKYHKNQTSGMRDAIKVFKKYKSLNIKKY